MLSPESPPQRTKKPKTKTQSEDELTHRRREFNDHPQDVHDRRTSFTKPAKLLAAFFDARGRALFVVGIGRHDSRRVDLYRVSVDILQRDRYG